MIYSEQTDGHIESNRNIFVLVEYFEQVILNKEEWLFLRSIAFFFPGPQQQYSSKEILWMFSWFTSLSTHLAGPGFLIFSTGEVGSWKRGLLIGNEMRLFFSSWILRQH